MPRSVPRTARGNCTASAGSTGPAVSPSTSATWRVCVSPGLFIIGGGISRKADKFLPLLGGVRARIVPAAMHNDAGIVGAAMAAARGPATAAQP